MLAIVVFKRRNLFVARATATFQCPLRDYFQLVLIIIVCWRLTFHGKDKFGTFSNFRFCLNIAIKLLTNPFTDRQPYPISKNLSSVAYLTKWSEYFVNLLMSHAYALIGHFYSDPTPVTLTKAPNLGINFYESLLLVFNCICKEI